MERLGDVALFLSELDLHDIEKTVWEPYHEECPGRPPRNPMGIFKALMVKRLWRIPSDKELYHRLWDDPMLREICDIGARRGPITPPRSPGSAGTSAPRGSTGSSTGWWASW